MKYFVINILFTVLLGCHNKQDASLQNDKKIISQDSLLVNKNTFKGLWQQYKKEGAIPNDTIPNRKCYVKINADSFYYINDKKVEYTDFLIKDRSYKYPVYQFRNHSQNRLHVLTKDFKEIQLKKYANEGDYEYFIKVSN